MKKKFLLMMMLSLLFTAMGTSVLRAQVAKVGNTEYSTLAEAVAEATEGETITMLADAAEDATIPAGVTFNGNGKAVGNITAAGTITFNGHTKATSFSVEYTNTTINIVEGACLEITGTGRMVIGHGCTFNITGTIAEAKTANVAELTPSLIMPGASFTGAGVTFNVTNAYISAPSSYCSSSKSASGTFDFNITNSIWESAGKLAFESQSTAATVNFDLVESVLNTGSHLVFGVSRGEVVIDNSNVNVGTLRQIENQSTMTIKNGSVVNGTVATSSNAKNPGTLIVDNATYDVAGEFSGSDLGTGTLIMKNGASFTAGSITKADIQIDATGMAIGNEINLTATLTNHAGTLEVINNDNLDAEIIDGKIVLVEKPVAQIGDIGYASLLDALNAAEDNETVVMNVDVELFTRLIFSLYTKGNKVTLDGNGHRLYASSTNWGTGNGKHLINVNCDNVTLKDVVLDCNNIAEGANIYKAQNIVFDNVSIINKKGWNADLTVNGSTLTVENKLSASYVDVDLGSGVDTPLGIVAAEGAVLDTRTLQIDAAAYPNTNLDNALSTDGTSYYSLKKVDANGNLAGYSNSLSRLSNGYGYEMLEDMTVNSNVTLLNEGHTGTLNTNGHILTIADGKKLTVNGALSVEGEGDIEGKIILGNSASVSGVEGLDIEPSTQGAEIVYQDGNYVVAIYVAKIGETKYATLALAVAAVEDGGTITLIANETFTEDNRYDNGGWWDGLGYSGDKSFTIDLGGFTIGQDGALNDYLMWFKNGGDKANTITLKNGTLDAGATAYSALATASSNAQKITVNLEDIKVINNYENGSTVKVRGGAELNVKDGTVITGKDSYLGIECIASTANIYDGAEIYMNGTSSYNGCLAGVGGNGTINVYGGEGQSKSGGFIAMTSGGTINVEGGEWTANTDGTYANDNKSVLVAQSADGAKSIVNVTGGTFKGGYNCYGAAVGDAQINIYGGNFNSNPSAYVKAGYVATEAAGIYTVVEAPAYIDGKASYASLAAAYEAAVNGDVIVLNESVTTFPVIKKAVTFKGGKEKAAVEINYALRENFTAIDGIVRFENLTFNKPLFTEHGGNKPSLSIEFEGCNFNVNSEEGYGILIGTSWSNSVVKGLKVNNCNFKYVGTEFKGGYMLYVQCVNEVTITNNTINGNNLYRGAIHLGDATEHATVATVSNNTIKNFCRGVMMGNRVAGSSATISGNTFDNINYNDKDSKPAHECAPIFIHSIATAEALQIALTNNKVENCTNPMIYSEDTDLIKYYVTEFTGNTVAGAAVELANSYYAPNQIFPVATINDAEYFTLQAAVNAVQNGETITLLSDITENVTVTQKADVKFTIDGAKQSRAADDNYTFTGYIIVDGKSSAYATAGVTIKNLNFDAKGIATDASINLGDEGNINNTRYTSNVTVDNCTFTGENQAKAAVKSYTGGDKNLTITNCTVDATMHSLAQLTNVDGVVIDNCTVNSKNGINLNSSANVVVENSKFEVGGYPVRIGVNEGTSGKVELTNNTLKTDNSEGDAAIVIRGTASTQVELTMTKNIVSGTTHISGTTEATNITADANYWDGQSAPVVAEGSTPVEVDTYYTALNEDGTIDEDSLKETPQGNQPIAYVKEVDGYVRVWGETWGNAKESYALELYSGETKIATTELNNVGGIINGSVNVTWNFFYPESTDEYWTTTWHEEPQADKQPDKVVLVIDGVAVNEGPVYMSGADGMNPVVWADLGGVISGGTWGGIDWTLVDGTLTITPTTGTPTTDNSGKWSYEIGQWPEAVIYNNNGVGVDIGLWPYERTKVKTLVIEEGVTSIGSFTAQGFTNLTGEVEIPYTVKYIGQEAFQRSTMTKLTFAPVPEGETGEELCIAQGALKNLVIEEITFPEDRYVHLHAWMFANSNNLKHVTFPATVVGIGGTVHVDYQHNPNATNGGGSNSCGLLSKCPALETITFGSQEVRDMYYNPYYERNDAPIVVNVGLKSYKDFRAGINAAKDGETVLLLGNVTLEDTWTIPAGMNITLDLNGKTINAGWADQSAGKHIYAFENHGTLTIKGEGTINARGNYNYGTMTLENGTINAIDHNGGYGIQNLEGSTFTMNGGTIAATYEDGDTPGSGYDATPVRVDEGASFIMIDGTINNICNYTVAIYNCGTTTIEDGTITSVHSTVANYGAMTIEGGSFTCNGLEGITAHALWAADGTTTINGGTFDGKDNYNGFNVDASEGATVYITDGNFLPVHSGSLYGEGTIAVSGGTFFDAVPEERCAAGYIPQVNSDGTYGVVKGLAGEGTEENPYLIKSLTDLKFFRDDVNAGNKYAGKYIKVTATEIDLNNEEWTPIAYMGKTFEGNFDGNNVTVKNLKITKALTNSAENNNIGFFGKTDSPATIENITIENVDITGSLYVGAIVGLGYTGKHVKGCTVKGDITIDAWWYAGVIGGNGYMNLIDNCHVIGNGGSYIKGNDGSYIGGIWGFRGEGNNKITNCTVTNLDIIGVDRVGGICGIGHYGNTISGCDAEDVTVTATDPEATTIGLLVGATQGNVNGPTIFENNDASGITAQIDNGDGTYTEVTNLYGTNIDGIVAVTNYVAQIVGGTQYPTLAEAVAAAVNNDVITLLPTNAPISMAASLYGKNVTITGVATVDWSKGNLFVGRGGAGNATLIFNGANLTSASDNASTGIHVSGREKNTNDKYDGTVIIKNNSTIELDYLINKGTMTLDNSTLTVKNGFSVGGRPAGETESGQDATATITLNNNSRVVVNNHNGMGLGYEAIGIMNINSGSTFETTQDFLITAKGTMNVNGGNVNTVGKLTNNGTINVTGESTLNIEKLEGSSIDLNEGAIVKNSTVGGGVFVKGKVTFRGDNTFAMLYDFGTLTDYYGTTANMEWTVEEGASLTLTDKARYGLGYGDNVTINGSITNALEARENLTEDDRSLFMHGLVAQESKGWNCNSKFTVEDAYVVIGSNNSFGNKPGEYGGNYTINFKNSVVDASRITFYEALSSTEFTFEDSDVNIGTFMTRDTDSKFTLKNSKVLSTTDSNGTDEGNYNAGELTLLDKSSLTYSAAFTNTGTLNLDLSSKLTAPSVAGDGIININATNFEGNEICVISANMASFEGVINVEGAHYMKKDNGIYVTGAQGTLTKAYTSATGYWGECGGNANESFVLRFYNDNTYMGQTSLNDIDNIIDGDVYVTWSIDLNIDPNAEGYWAMSWDIRPILAMQPNRVEQWIDGEKVAECAVEPNWADNIFPVVAAVTDENDVILSYVNNTTGATLNDAFAAGGNIAILRDFNLAESVTVPADKTVVLNLNGKTMSQTKACTASYQMIENKGALTIKDSTEGANGKISFKDTSAGDPTFGWGSYTVRNEGTLVVENGTIEHLGEQNQPSNVGHMYCAIFQYSGSSTINDGTISTPTYRSARLWKGDMTINGGTFDGQLWVQCVDDSAVLTINGGNFSPNGGDGSSVFVDNPNNTAKFTVTGGTFETKIGCNDAENLTGDRIIGGLFSQSAVENTNAALLGDGFEFVGTADANGYYSVIKTSGTFTRTLSSGWSWFSYYIDIEGSNGLDALKEDMGAACEQFKSHTAFTFYSNNKWYTGPNALTGTNVEDMYMVKMRESKEISLSGKLAVPEEEKITLKANGWTWIGYPLENSINVSDALATFNSIEGDYIKSKTLYAEYVKLSDGTYAWKGGLNSMIPGEGYKYKSVSGDEKEVYYSSASNRTAVKANVTSENNYWVASNSKYSSNMTVVAMMSIDNEIVNDSYEIAAFANGECRGSARAIYDEDLNAYMLYLTIHGEDVENITFKYYDVNYGTEYELGNVVVYSSDAILGSINNPYMFNLDILNVDEASINEVNVYPNPTTTNAEIDLNATCDKVEVFNALGVKVAEYSNVDSIDALETAGVYVIRVTIDGNVRNCRLVVK